MTDRAHVASCGSPLCLSDAAYLGTIWFSDEPICGARGLTGDVRRAQLTMRKLARVRAPGYFQIEHLTALRRVGRGTRGFDPDAPFDAPPRRLSRKKALVWRQEAAKTVQGPETQGIGPGRISRSNRALSTHGEPSTEAVA